MSDTLLFTGTTIDSGAISRRIIDAIRVGIPLTNGYNFGQLVLAASTAKDLGAATAFFSIWTLDNPFDAALTIASTTLIIPVQRFLVLSAAFNDITISNPSSTAVATLTYLIS